MTVEDTLVSKLAARFAPRHLDVRNESAGHNVPAGSETHFKVVLVSDRFENESRLARHRAVHEALREELGGAVHALALHTYTVDEWRARFGEAPMSPDCRGGKAREAREQ